MLRLDEVYYREVRGMRRVGEAARAVRDARGVERLERGGVQQQTPWMNEDEGRVRGHAASDQKQVPLGAIVPHFGWDVYPKPGAPRPNVEPPWG